LKLKDAEEEIYSGLLDLTREGGPGNFMVISAGDIYVQFAGSPGNAHVVCESIANEYLPKPLKMSAAAVKKLKKFGFKLGGDDIKNFSHTFALSSEDEARKLAGLTTRILEEIYAVELTAEVQIELSIE
jgi:hypothetical protein